MSSVTWALGNDRATPLDEGLRHVDREGLYGFGIPAVGRDLGGQPLDGLGIPLFGGGTPGAIGGDGHVIMPPGPGGLVDGKLPDPGEVPFGQARST